jgi:hypothetical protein
VPLLAVVFAVCVAGVMAGGCDHTLVVGQDPSDGAAADGGPGAASLTQGLLAYWKLDDGQGVASVRDRSPRGDHAWPEAFSASDWIGGRIDGGLEFGNAGWLRGTRTDGLDAIAAGGLTIAMWIRLRVPDDREQVIVQRQAGTGPDAHFILDMRLGRPALGGLTLARCEGPALPMGAWVHLAATFDGRTVRLLYDGAERATCERTAAIASDDTVLLVGGRQYDGEMFDVDRRLRADLDEVALWSRALTSAEVVTLAGGEVLAVP